jgi:hypothetical protein
MSMTYQFNRKHVFQASLVISILVLVITTLLNFTTIFKLIAPAIVDNTVTNPQRDILNQAIDLVSQQTRRD